MLCHEAHLARLRDRLSQVGLKWRPSKLAHHPLGPEEWQQLTLDQLPEGQVKRRLGVVISPSGPVECDRGLALAAQDLEIAPDRARIDLEIKGERLVGRPFRRPAAPARSPAPASKLAARRDTASLAGEGNRVAIS